jgi:parallel beta-helix repeat protein
MLNVKANRSTRMMPGRTTSVLAPLTRPAGTLSPHPMKGEGIKENAAQFNTLSLRAARREGRGEGWFPCGLRFPARKTIGPLCGKPPCQALGLTLVLLAALWFSSTGFAQEVDDTPGPGKFYVAVNGNDDWTGTQPDPKAGSMEGPFATIERALKEHRKGTLRSTIFVRGGTHHLAQPVAFLPNDSGLRLLAYKSERPVLSGGRPITGWKAGQNPSVWTATVPEARGGRWPMRLLRVGNDLQPLARNPNYDPANPWQGGWFSTVAPQGTVGAFGAALSRIQTTGDWIEWRVRAPADGEYRLWFLYTAANRPFGFADLADRTQVQVDGGVAIPLRNLPDSPAFRWAQVATLQMTQGDHVLRWTNTRGGVLNLDALLVTDDPAWNPNNRGTRPAAGRQAVTVQAEAFINAQCKEMVVPQAATATGFRDRFQFNLADMKQYRSQGVEIHIFPGNGAANAILAVAGIDQASRTLRVDPRFNADLEIRPGSRYFVANALEELNAPGEWALDAATGTLYHWPRVPNFERLGVVAALLDRLIEFKGDAAKNQWVEEVTIKGLQFSDTAYTRPANVLSPADAAIWLTGARRCVIERNQFVNLGGHAVRVEGGSTANEIVGNHIVDVGQGGVILLGDTATQPRDTLIAGNWMQRLGRVFAHVGGVYCLGAAGTKVQHNRIEQVPRAAIAFQSVDARTQSHGNTAEFNDIQHACMATTGSGGIEVLGRHKADTGNVIQHNRILDTTGLGGTDDGKLLSPHGAAGIYLGEFASGVTVRGNIVSRAPLGGLVLYGGRNNNIENNIFAEGAAQQVLFAVPDSFAEKNRLVRNIFYFSGPQAALYKHAVQWRPQVLSEVDGNILWHAQGAGFFNNAVVTPLGDLKKWQATGLEPNTVVANPGFAEAARDNFQMAPTSPALQKGFQVIPAEKIGLTGFARSWKR